MEIEQIIKQKEVKEEIIRVLYVVDLLKQRSGITAVVMNYFRNIDKSKVIIDFLVLEGSEQILVDEVKEAGSNIFIMPKLTMFHLKKFFCFIDTFFKEHDEYIAIHSHFNQLDSLIFPVAKRYGVKNCISHSHSTRYSEYKMKRIRNWIMCVPLKHEATVWAACGMKAGRFLYGKEFFNSLKQLIIRNAIETERFAYNPSVREKVRRELKIRDEILIGNVGRLTLVKNQEFLLEIFRDLLHEKSDKKYKLMIVGDGDLRDKLIKRANKLNISEYVIFTGQRNNVNELLQAMDIFLLPSLYEGLPVVGIESQAAGLPCIFSSAVTREADICNTVFLDIDKGTKLWVDEIQNKIKFNRLDTSKEVKEKGFDIHEEAGKLTSFYVSLMELAGNPMRKGTGKGQ